MAPVYGHRCRFEPQLSAFAGRSLIWRLAQVGAASLDDLNRDLLLVLQYHVAGIGEGLPVDDDAGGVARRDLVAHHLISINCLPPDSEKFLKGKVSYRIRVEMDRPGCVTSR